MPGYKKTKDVDLKKIQGQAAEELQYQKGYAKRALEKNEEAYRNTGERNLTRQGRATMERVAGPKPTPPKKGMGDATAEVLSAARELLKKSKRNYQQFKELGEK